MRKKIKDYGMGLCLFVFLFMVIGGGFHLSPSAALIAAASGTPLVIHAFNRRYIAQTRAAEERREEPACEVISLRERS